jgi:Kelch motif
MRVLRTLCMALVVSLVGANCALAQSWQPLKHQPSFDAGVALLLTDGTVLVQDAGTSNWWKLTPDSSANYVNGTWTQVASLPSGYAPLYFSSAVLPDGRVIVEGGEYNNFSPDWTNQGAIYDPTKNVWTSVTAPSGWTNIGDAQSVILTNGTFMQADALNSNDALLNESTLTWTATGTGKKDRNDEEGWTLLPDGTILTVDAIDAPNAEKYLPSTGQWVSAGSTIVRLEDPSSEEIGPAVLRPNGTVFATGATGNNAIYTPPSDPTQPGTWAVGPMFPIVGGQQLDIADGPAALLPDGNVLCAASPGIFNTPVTFFEFDGTNLNQVPGTPGSAGDSSYNDTMLELPTGQILLTDQSNDVEVYSPAGKANPAWAPRISSVPSQIQPGQTYTISGFLLNGVSQGAAYGDDAQMATNWPVVVIYNIATKHVVFTRTHSFSSYAVQNPNQVTAAFDVPSSVGTGASYILAVTNGIRSKPVKVTVQ